MGTKLLNYVISLCKQYNYKYMDLLLNVYNLAHSCGDKAFPVDVRVVSFFA